MTSKEVKEMLYKFICNVNSNKPNVVISLQEAEVIKELVERDTPKKVYSTDYHYCPNCKTQYLREYQKFCDWCGQRLDWKEKENE